MLPQTHADLHAGKGLPQRCLQDSPDQVGLQGAVSNM